MKNLYIIIDTSGSMNEMGKIYLQRNLCRYATQLRLIDQEKYADLDIHYYQWTQNISEIIVQGDGDIPALNAEGSSSLTVLSDFLSRDLNNMEQVRVLILSDGKFIHYDYKQFLKWKENNNQIFIRTVAVGADADLLKLKKISTNNSVHLSENIASAIDCAFFGNDEPLVAPVSTAQILQSEPEEPGDDWDA